MSLRKLSESQWNLLMAHYGEPETRERWGGTVPNSFEAASANAARAAARTGNDLVDDLAEQSDDEDFDLDIELEEKRHAMMDAAIRDLIFFKQDEENMTALKAAAWQTINHDEQNKGESAIGYLRIVPSSNPAALHLEDMSEERLEEARLNGGWNPDKDKYVHFTKDGDLEGLSYTEADELIWDNRQRILQAVRDDESANFGTVSLLHNCFNRERQVREHYYRTPDDKR